jgi:hypothetical protein
MKSSLTKGMFGIEAFRPASRLAAMVRRAGGGNLPRRSAAQAGETSYPEAGGVWRFVNPNGIASYSPGLRLAAPERRAGGGIELR